MPVRVLVRIRSGEGVQQPILRGQPDQVHVRFVPLHRLDRHFDLADSRLSDALLPPCGRQRGRPRQIQASARWRFGDAHGDAAVQHRRS